MLLTTYTTTASKCLFSFDFLSAYPTFRLLQVDFISLILYSDALELRENI